MESGSLLFQKELQLRYIRNDVNFYLQLQTLYLCAFSVPCIANWVAQLRNHVAALSRVLNRGLKIMTLYLCAFSGPCIVNWVAQLHNMYNWLRHCPVFWTEVFKKTRPGCAHFWIGRIAPSIRLFKKTRPVLHCRVCNMDLKRKKRPVFAHVGNLSLHT